MALQDVELEALHYFLLELGVVEDHDLLVFRFC